MGANLGVLFRLNLDEAVEKVLDTDRERREKAAEEFNVWLDKKKTKEEEAKQLLVSTYLVVR